MEYERTYSERLSCSKTTKKLLMNDCIQLFKQAHPDFHDIHISQGYILQKVVEFYLQ